MIENWGLSSLKTDTNLVLTLNVGGTWQMVVNAGVAAVQPKLKASSASGPCPMNTIDILRNKNPDLPIRLRHVISRAYHVISRTCHVISSMYQVIQRRDYHVISRAYHVINRDSLYAYVLSVSGRFPFITILIHYFLRSFFLFVLPDYSNNLTNNIMFVYFS